MLYGKRYKNHELRLLLLKKANEDFHNTRIQYYEKLKEKIDANTVLFIKGYGNDVELICCFRDLLFNSRELLDYLLYRLNKITENLPVNIPQKFLPFSKRLMKGDFDTVEFDILRFLKTNITFIYHIRKIRNEIKTDISNIEFRFVTDHFEAAFWVPIKSEEFELVQYLDINNKEKAIENKRYHCVFNLDNYFPEMIEFWNVAFSLLDKC